MPRGLDPILAQESEASEPLFSGSRDGGRVLGDGGPRVICEFSFHSSRTDTFGHGRNPATQGVPGIVGPTFEVETPPRGFDSGSRSDEHRGPSLQSAAHFL